MYPNAIRSFSQTIGYVTLALYYNPTHFLVFCSAHAFVTHIRNLQRTATAFRRLQRDGILADRRSQDRESPVEEEEVDWHEEDDPRAVQPVKKGETPQPPTHVLD